MAKKFYVVWNGRQRGVFPDWATCKRHTDGVKGARFKAFPTLEEAERAFRGGAPSKAPKPNAHPVKATNTFKAPTADVTIFSDGACSGNPGPAGSGLAIYRADVLSELWYGLYAPMGTNNTAELQGLYHALLAAQEELLKGATVEILSDSEYAIKAITQWAHGWKRQQWMDKSKPRANAEIIKPMYELYLELEDSLAINHVRGHQGIQGNELADRMAALAIDNEEEELRRYTDPLDIEEILAFTPG